MNERVDPAVPVAITDQSLVLAVRDGDEDAAAELYQRYARRVVGLVRSQMGTRLAASTEPEDIAQSIFISIFRGVREGSYDAPPGNTLWSLVAVIAVNKTRRKARSRNAAKRSAARSVPLDFVAEPNDLGSPDAADLKLTLDETLQHLRPLDRKILLSRISGESIESIAAAIDRTGRTVERSLKRSREKLADLLL